MNNILIKINCLRRLNLRNYKEKNNQVDFSCPICGDSKKSSTKARGCILNLDNNTYYYCHNCNIHMSFISFLKQVDYVVYQFYIGEIKHDKLKNFNLARRVNIVSQTKKDMIIKNNNEFELPKIINLKNDHTAKQYLMNRKISNIHYNNLYYYKGNPYAFFNEFFNSEKYIDKANTDINHECILIPKKNEYGKLVGFSLRNLNFKSTLRYINLCLDNEDFFFNQFNVDFTKPVYILEGQFDVLSFDNIKNKMAMCSLNKKFHLLNNFVDKTKIVYIIDNEYDNKNVIDGVKKIIENGYSIMIWPQNIFNKDINELKIDNNYSDEELLIFIKINTHNGMRAKMIFNKRLNEN